jgi:putative membrane protein
MNIYQAPMILVALIHIWIMYLEMVLWSKPQGLKIFRMTPQKAADTKNLAFNQGLYNGFLALALIWGIVAANPQMQIYGLVCVMIAGIGGAITIGKKILFIQSIPAAIALIVFCFFQSH